MQRMETLQSRRQLLKFLLGSPLMALGAGEIPGSMFQEAQLIQSPEQALNVFDFEAIAKQNIPPAHWGYLMTGVDDDATIQANRDGFARFQIRARHLIDGTRVDTSTELFGTKWKTPIFLSPVSSQRAFHSEGEIAVARAARSKEHLQLLSTVSSTSIEEVSEARGAPVWYQLYPTDQWRVTEALVKRAEAAGSPVIVFTVDNIAGRNTETDKRLARIDTRQCSSCHVTSGPQNSAGNSIATKPMFRGLDLTGVTALYNSSLTWEFVRRLRGIVHGKLVLKGIETREDAQLCLENGVDGIIVSNHGGRAVETGRGTIECLAEVVDAVQGRIPVLIDSGFRRGTDIFKALALGAKAVGVGRPYIWGLGAFGQQGVERVLDILRRETELIMRQTGAVSLATINRSFIVER
jgi:isopentenyl diphosphate isomerase/L-lactate dehydrogenase-like FMN-dependent dehydrogenase